MSVFAPCPDCESGEPQATCPCDRSLVLNFHLLTEEAAILNTLPATRGLRWQAGSHVMKAPIREWVAMAVELDRRQDRPGHQGRSARYVVAQVRNRLLCTPLPALHRRLA